MPSSERIRRIEAIPKRNAPRAGETAMLRRPSIVAFSGPCTRPIPQPIGEHAREPDADPDVGEVEIEPPRPKLDELRLDDVRATPTSEDEFTAGIVASAAETMAMLAEHRAVRPLALRSSREARILRLADAIFATSERAMPDVQGWWELMRDDGQPWAIWPPVFLLGLLDGPEGLLAIERLIESLRVDEAAACEVAADALAVIPHSGVLALAEDLLDAENPLARAVGLEVLSRRAALDVDRVVSSLDAQAPALLAAAIRALVRAEAAPRSDERVVSLLGHLDPDVAWEAARALALWGVPDPLCAVREGQPLATILGARALEVFVMAGDANDIAHMEALVTRASVSPDALDAIGRFGSPLAWSFLLHFLVNRELGEAAERALRTLFGPLVPPDAARDPAAWRDALMDRDFDPTVRYRGGEPWTPAVVVSDCDIAGGTRSQYEIERRIDEIAARTGRSVNVDMAAWGADAGAALRALAETALPARWRAGSWHDEQRRGR